MTAPMPVTAADNARERPISVGLAGAGPWAEKAYAPYLAAGPDTRLAGVWARRPEAARALAERHGSEGVDSFDGLLERCEAVAFAVPPDVQVELAMRAASAGKHLMLDKPLALALHEAAGLARAVQESGVVSQLMLTQRFRPTVRSFLESARGFGAIGARLAFLSGAFVRGPYATSWRREHGALHDLAPHAFDLLEAALGPIERIAGAGDPRRWVGLTCTHALGGVSELSLSGVMELPRTLFRIELYGSGGALELDVAAPSADEPWPAACRGFAEAVRNRRSPALDVQRGLEIQVLIDRALRAIA